MESVIANLGMLACQCELKAAHQPLGSWERELLTLQAQLYREAQLAELEAKEEN